MSNFSSGSQKSVLEYSDLVALLPSENSQRRPEIIKTKYLNEAILEVLDSENFESSINSKLQEKGIYLEIRRTVFNKTITTDEEGNEKQEIESEELIQDWLKHGFKCEIIKPGQDVDWQSGKIKVSLDISYQFEPDVHLTPPSLNGNPSSLEDIRQTLSA